MLGDKICPEMTELPITVNPGEESAFIISQYLTLDGRNGIPLSPHFTRPNEPNPFSLSSCVKVSNPITILGHLPSAPPNLLGCPQFFNVLLDCGSYSGHSVQM